MRTTIHSLLTCSALVGTMLLLLVGPTWAEEDTPAVDPIAVTAALVSDPITMAINVAWEAQDAVRARTEYLHKNSAGEMPRYVTMKQGILLEKQAMAIRVLDLALRVLIDRGGAVTVRLGDFLLLLIFGRDPFRRG